VVFWWGRKILQFRLKTAYLLPKEANGSDDAFLNEEIDMT
jgi:hypothetical protein